MPTQPATLPISEAQLRALLEYAEVASNPRWGYRFLAEKRSLYLRRQLESAHAAPVRWILDWVFRGLSLDQIEAEVNNLINHAQRAQPIAADASTAAHRKAKARAENTARLLASLRNPT